MKIMPYLKGKIVQFKTPKKELYNESSDKLLSNISLVNIYANEVYKAGDANGFYIFRLQITITDKNIDDIFKLIENFNKNNIGFTLVELNTNSTDHIYRLYMYGTARSFASLINKFIYNVYGSSNIIHKGEVNNLLLYPAIYRCVYGNMNNFDLSLPEDAIANISEKVININLQKYADTLDTVWLPLNLVSINYDYIHNEFTPIYFENYKLKDYMETDNILEEEINNKFDPSIDEII